MVANKYVHVLKTVFKYKRVSIRISAINALTAARKLIVPYQDLIITIKAYTVAARYIMSVIQIRSISVL